MEQTKIKQTEALIVQMNALKLSQTQSNELAVV